MIPALALEGPERPGLGAVVVPVGNAWPMEELSGHGERCMHQQDLALLQLGYPSAAGALLLLTPVAGVPRRPRWHYGPAARIGHCSWRACVCEGPIKPCQDFWQPRCVRGGSCRRGLGGLWLRARSAWDQTVPGGLPGCM